MKLLTFALALVAAGTVQAQDTTRIAIVATTDVHGRAMHWDYAHNTEAPLGLTRVATVVDSIKNEFPGNVVVVDAGDLIQGNPMATVFSTPRGNTINPMVDVLNAIGYDAMVLGNHEFNFGVPTLDRIMEDASFAVLGANVYPLGGERPAYRPAILIRRSGVRVGITGFTTPGSMVWDRANLQNRLTVRPILPAARETMTSLESTGVDLVIALVHSGMDEPSSYAARNVGAENVARELALVRPQPDVVVVGHSHKMMEDSVLQGVHFVQPRNWAASVSVVEVTMVNDSSGFTPRRIVGKQVDLADVAPSPSITRRLADAHDEVLRWTSTPMAAVEGRWSARFSRVEDTPIIDFINEVQRRSAGTQLSATSAFNTDVTLEGAVTFGDMSALYPYENTLRAVAIDGATLRAYLEKSAEYFLTFQDGGPYFNPEVEDYNFDIVSGVDYVIDVTQPAGSRIRQLSYRGTNVLPTDSFSMAVNSYRQEGGGGYSMFNRLPVIYDRGESVRNLLSDAAASIRTLNASDFFVDSWRITPATAANAIRQGLGGSVRSGTVALRLAISGSVAGGAQPSGGENGARRTGGFVAESFWMDSLASDCRCTMVRLDAGNSLSGTPIAAFSGGRVVVDGFNALGIQASALALADLRVNPDTLSSLAQSAGYTMLSANVSDAATGRAPPWVRPWALYDEAGARVAVLGITSFAGDEPISAGGFRVDLPTTSLQTTLDEIDRSAPRQTVLFTDAAIACEANQCSGRLVELLSPFDSTRISAVVTTGSSQPVNTRVNGIMVVAPGSGANLAVLDVVQSLDGSTRMTAEIQPVWADVPVNQAVASIVESYRTNTDRIVNQAVTTLRTNISRGDGPEYPLGRLIADAIRNGARTEAALVPNTHIANDIPAGPLTYGDLFGVLATNEDIVVLTIRGELLKEALEWALFEALPSAHISGLVVRYDPRRNPGQRIRDLRFPDGVEIKENDMYTLAVPSSVHAGDDQYPMLFREEAESKGVSELDALANYLRRLPRPVQAPRTRRFTPNR